jgi:alanine transaminase
MQQKVLTQDSIGKNVKGAEYAIRGYIIQRADEIQEEMSKGKKMPFKKLLYCNIGNPLSLGQPTFSFDREVLSCAMNPSLLTSPSISQDAKDRAKAFLASVDYPHALGAYTSSPGLKIVRESVKRYIEERDKLPCNINNLYLSNGASDAVQTIFTVLLTDPKDGVF